ncbi:hypothetical protein OHB11_17570 [Streptomyces zaomyceticus]|uniref:Uncharacterized protein n=1 Tax=Streptomyces zaomyceticus TaxID=68286 RepID=A0ABZ1L9H5_9ACTN|nr:hypothetical protein OG237_23925 [Streptomyces zaomyceticus]
MTGKSEWQNHPHGYLVILALLLVFLIIEDDTVTRIILAWALFSGAVVHGREWAKRSSRKATD